MIQHPFTNTTARIKLLINSSPTMASSSSSSSSLSLVRLIETCRVSPPEGSVAPTAVPLTFFDVIWLYLPPVERLFFYPFPHPTSHFLSSFLPSLKSSLSLSLRSFFPLAALLRPSPDASDRFELFFSDATSPGVRFTVAECSDAQNAAGLFDHLADGRPREVSLLRQLVPSLAPPDCTDSPPPPRPPPVFAVQVTVFPSRGLVVGTAVHHAVCDGSSIMRFMRCWSASAAAGAPAPAAAAVVVVDRTLVPDPHDVYSTFYEGVSEMRGSDGHGAATAADRVFASFTLRKRHVQALKDAVSARAAASAFHCSTVVVTFAFAFVGYVRAKRAAAGEAAHMGFAADFRSRMRPPLPAEYFGNCVGPCFADVDAADLGGDDGLVVAAEAIGRAIGGLGKSLESARDWLRGFKSRAAGLILTVAGSPKFGVYGVDFGWGRPAKVEVVSVANTGAVAVAESRDEEGGVEVGLGLPRNEMDVFQNYYFDTLKCLDDHPQL
ncbi:coumaroyl-CoA:anthocyanidin 3-O-glucoside-6''-O-coumaroyltransferase 2-like [Ananas comosus]|uniref:Coumaroyl-CoA:anthocyanidin 3-O-glucoside-6''-O-coumaroyltransferase 2-like n=1 Tax=Ananas comosus TaxID=4615 RepID=A0A6P5ECT8_ANACO|nr:coumaroyl-CoA:anthocyanidin 3-O-glucoside-6''-O-coumaroyltransferase 2-like [Ananas comosus]